MKSITTHQKILTLLRRLKKDDEKISSSELMTVLNQIKNLCDDQKIIDLVIASVKSLMERDLPFKEKLTDRESEITIMISKGYPSDIIAQRLNLSKSTIETHRKNIRKTQNNAPDGSDGTPE